MCRSVQMYIYLDQCSNNNLKISADLTRARATFFHTDPLGSRCFFGPVHSQAAGFSCCQQAALHYCHAEYLIVQLFFVERSRWSEIEFSELAEVSDHVLQQIAVICHV